MQTRMILVLGSLLGLLAVAAGAFGAHGLSEQDSKVFKTGAYLVGCSESVQLMQILRYNAELPAPPEDDLDRFMATTFVENVRKALDEHEAASAGAAGLPADPA